MSRKRTADAYIRVSRRAGREGESFISPEVQRKKIEDRAKLHEVEILEWWEELDQSGAKLERPLLQQALTRCEAGETGGIVVAKPDRFARSAVDALGTIRRPNEAGARLVSVEDVLGIGPHARTSGRKTPAGTPAPRLVGSCSH